MIIDETLELEEDHEGWVEINRLEALNRLENVMTRDIVAFEVEHESVSTPVGSVESFTWFKVDEFDAQVAMFLCLRDTSQAKMTMRWFIHEDLLDDQPEVTR